MRKLLLTSGIIMTFTFITLLFGNSCKKDNTTVNNITAVDTTYIHDTLEVCHRSIDGLWVGTATTTGTTTPQYFSLIFKPDGTAISDTKTNSNPNSQYLSVGTWSLTGTTISYNITNVWGNTTPSYIGQTQNGTGTFSSLNGTITNGNWTNPSPFSSGTFVLTKVE